MRRVFVMPKVTFADQGVTLLAEKDGGVQLSGFLNTEKETVDFPPGVLSGKLGFSIPFDKFEENLTNLYKS